MDTFLNNKYTRCYYRIVDQARQQTKDGYIEKHHVVPKSLGGSNDDANLVRLTPREHFLCHRLLTKMVQGKALTKMRWALHLMMHKQNAYQTRYIPNSRTFDLVRRQFYDALRQPRVISENHRANIVAANKRNKTGKKASDQTRKKMSESHAAHMPQNVRAKISTALKGIKRDPEALARRPWHTCVHCGYTTQIAGTIGRYHNDRCKKRSYSQFLYVQ